MEVIRVAGSPHKVFDSIEEFSEHFKSLDGVAPPVLRDWREGYEGDWVVADDGGVCQILRSGESKTTHLWKRWVRTAIGTYSVYKNTFMDTDKTIHKNRYQFGTMQSGKKVITKKNRMFMFNIIAGKPIKDAYEDVYGPHVDWQERALAIIRRPMIMAELKKTVKEVAKGLGLTVEFVLSVYKDIIETSSSDSARLSAAKEVGELLDIKGNAIQNTQGRFQGFSRKELEEADFEEADSA